MRTARVLSYIGFLALAVPLLEGCASSQPFVWYSSLPVKPRGAQNLTIGPGDRITVLVEQHTELSGDFLVGVSGEYTQPNAGLILVAGADPIKAAEIIRVKLARFYQEPKVTVTISSYRPIAVAVLGEVKAAGRYEVPNGASLITALGSAGGLTDFASRDSIYVLRARPAGQRIRFRFSDLTRPDPAALNFELHEGDAVVVE